MTIATGTLRVATYNIHKCRGIDMQFAPQRIISVLRELDADVHAALNGPAQLAHEALVRKEIGRGDVDAVASRCQQELKEDAGAC